MTKHFDPKKLGELTTIQQIEKMINNSINSAMRSVIDQFTIPSIRKYINKNWYGVQSGSYFYKSQNMMSKIYEVKDDDGNRYFKIGYKTDKLTPNANKSRIFAYDSGGITAFHNMRNKFPSYMNITTGEDNTENMPYVIEKGWSIKPLLRAIHTTRLRYNNFRTERQGIDVKGYIMDNMPKKITTQLGTELQSKGYNIRWR
ncbi:MAG: hypothetical protein ACLFPS_09025 [Clostridia bacterium]